MQEGKAAFSLKFRVGVGSVKPGRQQGPHWSGGPIFLYPLPTWAREASSDALLLSSGLAS